MNKQFIVRADVPKEPALIIKNQLLLSPGNWKGQNLTRESILKGLKNTSWNDGKSNSIIYGHRTNNRNTYFGDPSPDMWVGYHTEPKYLTLSDGVSVEGMYADYLIFDTELAAKLAYGGVRAGVSEGMEYDYLTGEIQKFINSSIVNDPACKNAFLNLSEEESGQMELSEPRFLNLNEEKPKEDVYTDERGLSDKKNMEKNDMEDKMKVFDEKISKVESALEEISKKLSEKKVEEETTKVDETKKEVDEPKPENKPKEPVVIEAPKPKEDDSNKVVDAIKDMGNKFVEEVKRVANPQSVAPTNPNAVRSTMDDEKITEDLVEQYSKLHPEIKDE
jgi:hypothetical protein